MSLLPAAPDFCGLGLTAPNGEDVPLTPTLTTQFNGTGDEEMVEEAFWSLTGAKLDFRDSPDRVGYYEVVFTAIHDCEATECPTLFAKLAFDIPKDGLSDFMMIYEKKKSFLWMVLTPKFEGRAIVSKPTSLIAKRTVLERVIH